VAGIPKRLAALDANLHDILNNNFRIFPVLVNTIKVT